MFGIFGMEGKNWVNEERKLVKIDGRFWSIEGLMDVSKAK